LCPVRALTAWLEAASIVSGPVFRRIWLPKLTRPGEPPPLPRIGSPPITPWTVAAWTVERLRRTVRRLVSEGTVEAKLLDRAPRQQSDDRLLRLVAGIAAAAPDRTLQQIASQLEGMRERTPRGGTRWHPSPARPRRSLKNQKDTLKLGRKIDRTVPPWRIPDTNDDVRSTCCP
jgi:hypothetical protein